MSVVLLHGLAGHAGEWDSTAVWLRSRARVVALDARGHGGSERRPDDVSLVTQAADVAHVIEELGLNGTILVGQSFGGLTAMLLASSRPDLVSGLVVVEADPGADDVGQVDDVEQWLGSWPTPFPSKDAARAFFGGSPVRAAAWADGLEHRGDGWYPRFEAQILLDMLAQAVARSWWEDWQQIECPILVVRARDGELTREIAQEMIERSSQARLAELDEGGHDLHLNAPDQWRKALEGFAPLRKRGGA